MYVRALSTWQSGWVGNQPGVGPRFDTSCSPDSTSAVCDAAADTLYGPTPCNWCDEMISELGGRLPSTRSSRQPLRCAARVFVVAHHLLKRYLGALQPVVWQNHARQLRLLWSSIYRTLASLNLSCQPVAVWGLESTGPLVGLRSTLLSAENSGTDQLIVVELIKP